MARIGRFAGLQAAEATRALKYLDSLSPGLTAETRVRATEQALEYLRKLKSSEQALNALRPSLEVKYVATCDLALNTLGYHVGKDRAVAASGCSAKTYETFRALCASLLGLKSVLTIQDVAIRLGIESTVPGATTLLAAFKTQIADGDYDGVPDDQFIACALLIACSKLNIRIPKRELQQISKLKSDGFSRLVSQMEPFYRENLKSSQPSTSKRKAKMVPRTEEHIQDEPPTSTDISKGTAGTKENYEAFRLRILREAFKELENEDTKKYDEMVKKFAKQVPELFPASPNKRKRAK